MRQLLPRPAARVDPYDVYRPADPAAPLLRVNMVASADGAATDERGRAGGLGGEGDLAVFRTLRALADGILVGAGTVRAEGYGPHRMARALADRRRADGRQEPATVVVVTRSLELDLDAPLFTEARASTVVLTCACAPPQRVRRAQRIARVLVVGDEAVDLPAAVGALRDHLGLSHLLCEGGPDLNRQVFQAGLADELCLTVAPALLGVHAPRIVSGTTRRVALELDGACEQDGELYLRYGVLR